MDMLTCSKERVPQKVEADLNETVGDVAELMNTRANDMGVKLVTKIGGELPTAQFDPDAFHQAILNLVTNAIDAAAGKLNDDPDEAFDWDQQGVVAESAPPTVEIETGYDKETGWFVDVTDNGPGIAAGDREKVFSLFESKKGARGTGLGLPVSAKIMREHGGSIKILETDCRGGIRFRLTLPNDDPGGATDADSDTDGDSSKTMV
jgi:signal transduction histidine kinase